ncbi:MAG: TrmH family RNA methyltransferase [Lachnospiraceae bacterium]|nr:TrmH family RNA methyltransferase [Lachnospiraceae bacterium]
MKRYQREDEISYSLGITLTFELLKYATEYCNRVYVHSKMDKGESFEKLKKLCDDANIPMEFADKPFNILSQKENCFIIGEFRKFKRPVDKNESHVVLNNPSNAGNMGTIMRSAAGFGITNLVIISPAVDEFDPKTVRASMGAIFRLNISVYPSFDEYRKQMGDRSYYPFMLKAKTSLSKLEPVKPFSLIFGNEATGLPDSFLEVGTSVIIPHSDRIDSLNLPIAASIALYEATKNDFTK